MLRKERGFTLIEVLVVITILTILAALIVPRIMDRPDIARQTAAQHDINAIKGALDLYRLDNRAYPSTDQGLQALVQKPDSGNIPPNWKTGGYLERQARGPWGHEYQYLNPGVHNPSSVDVFSYGRDGLPGGEGLDADIGNWDPTGN